MLLVEDSFLVAASTANLLREMGCRVVGPFSNAADARDAVQAGGCDAAILDINLGSGHTSEPIAEDLAGQGVPFVFLTSYSSPILKNARFAASPRLHKPLSRAVLAEALARSVGRRAPESGQQER